MRPGVAITTSGDVRRTAAWELTERPPTTSAIRMSVNWASFCIMECTCAASSRVGVSTST